MAILLKFITVILLYGSCLPTVALVPRVLPPLTSNLAVTITMIGLPCRQDGRL